MWPRAEVARVRMATCKNRTATSDKGTPAARPVRNARDLSKTARLPKKRVGTCCPAGICHSIPITRRYLVAPLRYLGTLAAAGALAITACADPASGPGNVDPRNTGVSSDVTTIPAGAQTIGTVDICKVVTGAGATLPQAFSFSVQIGAGAPTNPSINVTALNTPACITINTQASGPTDIPVTIIEAAPPANFALADLDIETWVIQAGESTTLGTRTAVAVVDGDDYARVVFTNNFTAPPPPPAGCTRTQGFWQNHPELWDALGDANTATFITSTLFFNSGLTYLQILQTSAAGGNAYIILAHQYIAARLNQGAGASTPAAVATALAGAQAFFTAASAGTPAPAKDSALRTQVLGWATTLDNYNNGIIGPGHCDED